MAFICMVVIPSFSCCLNGVANFTFSLEVSHVQGSSFQSFSQNDNPKPVPLIEGALLTHKQPFAVLVAKDSYLALDSPDKSKIRIGQQSIIEFYQMDRVSILKGSILVAFPKTKTIILETKGTNTELTGLGTFMFESPKGSDLKIIMLEGKAMLRCGDSKLNIKPGELVLAQSNKREFSQVIKVDLPLLITTSRLINNYPTPLPTQSKLISAAKVQAIRLKKKYQALIGNTNEKNQLKLWAIKKAKKPSQK